MGYQIITHSDNYYENANKEMHDSLLDDIKWVRNTELGILPVKSGETVIQDTTGVTHTIKFDWEPADPSNWRYVEKVIAPLSQFQVMEDTTDKFHLVVNYVTNHTFVVEVRALDTDEVLMREIGANFEPRFGVDVLDMENILRTAEDLCLFYESGDYQEFLKVE